MIADTAAMLFRQCGIELMRLQLGESLSCFWDYPVREMPDSKISLPGHGVESWIISLGVYRSLPHGSAERQCSHSLY